MSDEDSPELSEFRNGVRAWIHASRPHAPPFKLPQTFLEVESRQQFDYLLDWQKKLYAGGHLGFDTPQEYGGRGVHPDKQRIVQQELTRARTPFLVNVIGLFWAGPTILSYGTEQQKKRLLAPLLRGDEIWCQGFSEPSAGSDLASLETRAVRVGAGWEVTREKVCET